MVKFSLKLYILGLVLLLSLPVGAARLQLFGIQSIDGILSLDYENFSQSYGGHSSTTSSTFSQNYELSLDTFILHPKLLTWDIDGEFGISRTGDETQFTNHSYGTSIRLLRDFFVSTGLSYSLGQDEVQVPYSPSYIRNRESLSTDLSLRLRHLPTSFSYKKTELNSDAEGHEEDSVEHRLGLNTNFWFGRDLRGSFRLSGVQQTDRLANIDPDTQYYDANISHSWSPKESNWSWNSGLKYYQKTLPTTAQTVNVNETLNYRNSNSLSSNASFSYKQNAQESYEENRIDGKWKLSYDFTDRFSGGIDAGLSRMQYDRETSSQYTQDRIEVSSQARYRVQTEDFTYYASASGGYLQRIVDGEGKVTTSEDLQFDLVTDSITLSYPHVDVDSIEIMDQDGEVYDPSTWDYRVDPDGYVIIDRRDQPTNPDVEPIPPGATVKVTYSYTPQQDGKQVNGSLRVGADKKITQNVTLSSYVTGSIRKDLDTLEEVLPVKSYELYLGSTIKHERLTFTGSLRHNDRRSAITGEAKYTQGSFNLTGRYANEFSSTYDPRHNLSLSGNYYTYIPIGIRLNLKASDNRVYRSGELIDGGFSCSALAQYPIRRYMWLKDELKLDLSYITDNSLRWSNLIGFEWKQGMLSFNTGYELVGNNLTGYHSSRLKVEASRRF